MSERLEQHAKTEKAKTLGEIVTETNLKYAGKKQCDVKSAWLPVGEQEKWVREKRLVDAQQHFQELQVETKKLFKTNYELEGRLQRIRDLMDQGRTFAEIQEWVFQPKEYRSSPTCGAYDSVLTDNRLKIKWVSDFELLAVVGEGSTEKKVKRKASKRLRKAMIEGYEASSEDDLKLAKAFEKEFEETDMEVKK